MDDAVDIVRPHRQVQSTEVQDQSEYTLIQPSDCPRNQDHLLLLRLPPAGIAGATPLNDAEAWGPRIAQGRETLYANVKRGMTPGMPPRGACPGCTDQALEAAVDYMVLHAE